ncbi:MAG: N-acetyltransferase family protein [Hyphomonadaceae bacterium]|jgi:phosphinothricin acetyltransferase|nr:N-acetyltransferase family protein [Hyphomonadaceae bacterium]
MSQAARLRHATLADLDAVTAIYAHHVLTGTGSFEIEPPDRSEMGNRMDRVHARGLPWIVAEQSGMIVGFAYAGPFKERAAYAATVENSVYLAPGCAGRGLGRCLLDGLLAELSARGIREVLAVIGDSENHASIGLHTACGFRPVGTFTHVGRKFGRDLDVVLMQKSL